jgi:preprotein translocase subunit YajC
MDLAANLLSLAMAPAPQQGGSSAPGWTSFVPLILLLVVFYFLLIRPQQKKAKEHAELLKQLRPGDKVLTSGGVIGTVIGVKEKVVSLRSGDAKLEVTKSAVGEILERSGDAPQS